MNDEFDSLKAALKAAPPAPDADAKARALRIAQENFDQHQETRAAARQTDKRPTLGARLSEGVDWMFKTLTTRAALAATTGIATVAVAFFVIAPQLDPTGVPTQTDASKTKAPATVIADDLGALVRSDRAAPETALRKIAPAPQATAPEVLMMEPEAAFGGQMSPAVDDYAVMPPQGGTEAFANGEPNPLKITSQEPVSTFSIDVDTASYAIIRSSLNNGQLPPPDAVRVEEMVNYFPYAYPAPEGDAPFQPTVSVIPTPWNDDTQLVHIAIQGALPETTERPPLNLVFLIDTSGSMNSQNKLPLLKQSFRLMLSKLRPEDEVAIVTYAGSAGQVLAPTPASDRNTILAALSQLDAGGSTAGQAGLQQAYATAETMTKEGEVTRVLLATDGDFNVGLSDPKALETFISGKRDQGTYLSVLGFGRGNLDDATMQALAQNGNGQAAYIDTLNEAQKVLVDQLSGALFPIANDVKIQVEFNPAAVAEYRLIGYETRALNREDFNNDKVDAGEIGAGHNVTALYEVTPVGSPAVLNDPLRYSAEQTTAQTDELGFLRLRYKSPGDADSQLIETPIATMVTEASNDTRFATAIAGFGQLLRDQKYLRDWTIDQAIDLANSAKGADPYGYRAEAVNLMRLYQSLSAE